MNWLYTRWLELQLGWLTIKKTRLDHQLRMLKRERDALLHH
jgi:hypothetical protein